MESENQIENITLPFDQIKQNALLGHLLINEQFFKIAHTRIDPSWFLSTRNSQVYKLLIDYFNKYTIYPNRFEFASSTAFQLMEPKERNLLHAHMTACIGSTNHIRLEVLKPELTEWLHSVILMRGLNKAKDSFNSKKITDCHRILMDSVKEVQTVSFNGGNTVGFADYKKYLKESQETREHALTTGLKILDRALLKEAPSGGLQPGDTTIVMGPVNVGKSTVLISMACANIRAGKDVLYMTHEDAPEDIRLKFLANMTKLPIHKLLEYDNPEVAAKLDSAVKFLDKHLRYEPYTKAGMTVEEVLPIIRYCQDERTATHGKGFDLFVSDYPASLLTTQAKSGQLTRRHIDEIVYRYYIQLALEYNFHALLAIQTNREGSKINKGISGENRLLEMEDVKESWDPMALASNVITLNRSPNAAKRDCITFNIAKCRSNAKGVAILARSDFSCATSHSEDLGGNVYEGTMTQDENADSLLTLFHNEKLPSTLIQEG